MIPQEVIDEFNKRAPFPLIGGPATLIVLANVGSDSHGTKLPKDDPSAIDDVDFVGIVIPPPEYVMGVEQWEGVNFWAGQYDCVFYSLHKLVRLLIKANPNVVGMLWLREEDVHHSTLVWQQLVENRELFSTREAYASFAGYARGQMHRMTHYDLKTQQEWDGAVKMIEAAGWTKEDVLRITSKQEQRRKAGKEYDEEAITDALPMPNHDAVWEQFLAKDWPNDDVPLDTRKYLTDQHLKVARIVLTRIHARHFQGYMGEKRKALVTKHGFDTKNAAHLIRLLRMGVEFIQTGNLRVYRDTDKTYLMAIKRGEVPLDEIKTEAERLFALANESKESSPLPEAPDRVKINQILRDMYLDTYDQIWLDQLIAEGREESQ